MPEKMLSKVRVKDIRHLIVEKPPTTSKYTPIELLLDIIIKDTRTRHVYIVNDQNALIGSVRLNNIIQFLFPSILLTDTVDLHSVTSFLDNIFAKKTEDIMNKNPAFVFEDSLLSDMIKIMHKEKVNELPVLDSNMKIIGEVNVLEIITYYRTNYKKNI